MSYSELILASSSETRQQLLQRLALPFRCISPDIDESAHGEQHADDLALRLAQQKAHAIAQQYPNALVIGSDQVAWRTDNPQQFLGKPLTVEKAIQQLLDSSGKTVNFSTAISVQQHATGFYQQQICHYAVQFRTLNQDEIERYITHDNPLHCAGSFKAESLGISLFQSMHGDDFTSLMGLPLIALTHILRQYGLTLP